MSALFGVPVDAAYHVVFALTTVLTPLLGALAAVVAIVVCTAAVRLLVSPLTFRALRGQAAQARLAPEVQRLRQRFGKQPDRLQRELTALYQREGTSLFAGFAPLLAQAPVFSVLYLLFRSSTVAGAQNRLLSHDLLGVPLGSHWLSGAGALSVHGVVFAGVLAVLAAACWLAARAAKRALPGTGPLGAMSANTTSANTTSANTTSAGTSPAKTSPAGTSPAGTVPAGATSTLAVVGKIAPYLTVLFAAFTPLAAAIYLVTSTSWSAAERLVFAARTNQAAMREQAATAARTARPGRSGHQSGGRSRLER